ncbi:DNA methyltransferase [Luteibacter sp. UNCMF366Tsu5.1]|uniref:DNA methyltransferase n=1 Tax=Luteibacter sp. UNCMF366Tsu5.1 TaxID=1502758 RepID=UPI000908AD5D|nr:DNA methyltransferase [Luteibacter sp. UNCMF366Tsu5.1]SFW74597.1 Methyltransferase domain-containing protein [Luteibacter sp. UNCMF366Tsu5.1]
MTERTTALSQFVAWCATHIKGDEKGEAQIFLDHLFRAFGHEGVKEAGAALEERIKKAEKGTSFADLVWKPVVLIEMKKRGEDLNRHYRQAFDYWTRLVPGRPRYVVLCNFDEFWVYDFETQMDTPVDTVRLSELPERFGPLAFLFPHDNTPIFGNHQEQVTRDAADKLVELFKSMTQRGVERALAQRFTLQALMALFAEDIGLLEPYFFAHLLRDCNTPADAYDLIGQLFVEMNTPGVTGGGRFKGVPYFNGGLFASPARIELTPGEIDLLRQASDFHWGKVRPEIFGAIFEHSMDAEERRAYGAHYTSPVDIMKVVGPTIVEPWRAQIEGATTLKGLELLLARIESFRVLDPACGSGNFLYIAYRELKRLEARIYERMGEYKSVDAAQRPFGFVTARNFYGMDINPFAVELAKVTMMLAHKLAIDELHISENALPLDNLDKNFYTGDALLTDDNQRTPWPDVDVIVGNPPFLGAKLLKPKLGSKYVTRLRRAYPEVPGMADLCVYWFRRAANALPACSIADPVAGRAGLVGTQNIRNNASRIGGLDAIARTGTIVEAVDNQPWSGEANVHVSIANWAHTKDPALLPKVRKLWFKAAPQKTQRAKRGAVRMDKQFELDVRNTVHINSALSDRTDVSAAMDLSAAYSTVTSQGVTPGHDGFVIDRPMRDTLVEAGEGAVVRRYLIGRELLGGEPMDRYIIDFGEMTILEAKRYPKAFAHLERTVLPDMIEKAKKSGDEQTERATSIDFWWRHWRPRTKLVKAIREQSRFLVCSRITKRPIFDFVTTSVLPGDALQVFALEDDYSFGILQSSAHYLWFHAKCSNMKSDPRYTSESVFDTFPWPQAPSDEEILDVAKAGHRLRELRRKATTDAEGGLRALYRTLDIPGRNPLRDAHDQLDRAVLKAYHFGPAPEVLEAILALNLRVAERIAAGERVQEPGVPDGYGMGAALLSTDALGSVP